jgi:hypothetical protein
VESLKILLVSVLTAVSYGILQDQVTARVCVEYFTVGHPPVFATDDPTLLAFGFGTLATWWVGVLLAGPLVWAARSGRQRPKLGWRDLVRPALILMAMTGFTALIAGFAGFSLARLGVMGLWEPFASRVPLNRHALFLADAFAHATTYLAGFVGALVVCYWVSRERRRRSTDGEPLL